MDDDHELVLVAAYPDVDRAATDFHEVDKRIKRGLELRAAALVTKDAAPEVRRAGIDALGALKQPEGLPVLEVAFVDNTTELRQAAARAIYAIGGPPAVATLERLATTGPPDSQRYAVVALMLIDEPSKSAAVERLGHTHPDPDIRKLITEGPDHHH